MAATVNGFNPTPSRQHPAKVVVEAVSAGKVAAYLGGAVAVPISSTGEVPASAGLSRQALSEAGFDGRLGQTLVLPRSDGPPLVAVGVGDPDRLDTNALRDAAAAFSLAVGRQAHLAASLADLPGVPISVAAQAVVEGVLLARYHYGPLQRRATREALESLTLLVPAKADVDSATEGVHRGTTFAAATALARDLANTPPSRLTAARMAECAAEIAGGCGLEIEVFDREALIELGCGGLLGVNAGSAEPPRMIILRYRPASGEPSGHLCLVGKGIMYDSGGISLKPSDAVHATMKNDMSGAGAILAAMSALSELDCQVAVTGYLMCTDNMPSGTAMKLGDVISIHGGTTVEVLNTDAEGRLVMADALVMAAESQPDAIVDIATLTGACLRALGSEVAGLLGNNPALIDQIQAAAVATDEPVWQLPLDYRHRKQLDSDIADIKNMGGLNAGTITAALFLAEFVGGLPWAHLDIAGTAQNDAAALWRPAGCTGFGARLLLELATTFIGPEHKKPSATTASRGARA
ncbi:putative cytosol aminopeptidase [Rhizocola hellebori]|uniref:Probable cytosol aminopeptidase n=1 Tax=Rhizocola hellebori TaxID=1392758 RepID=A0A8J3QAM0_9ACTN|nr:leucyl aminopeptidase [Rhizocola hellebori]GIH06469.1 putative cytosol aminopeptidase [Rhizocola hellebori]